MDGYKQLACDVANLIASNRETMSRIDKIESSVGAVSSKVGRLSGHVDDLTGQVRALSGNVHDLLDRDYHTLERMQTFISLVSQDMTFVKGQLSEHDKQIRDINGWKDHVCEAHPELRVAQ